MNYQLKLDSVTNQEMVVPTGKRYAIYNILFSNIAAAASVFNGWIVNNGDTNNNDNLFVSQKNIPAGDIFVFNEKLFLSEGDKLSFALDSGSNQINVFISYIEI